MVCLRVDRKVDKKVDWKVVIMVDSMVDLLAVKMGSSTAGVMAA